MQGVEVLDGAFHVDVDLRNIRCKGRWQTADSIYVLLEHLEVVV